MVAQPSTHAMKQYSGENIKYFYIAKAQVVIDKKQDKPCLEIAPEHEGHFRIFLDDAEAIGKLAPVGVAVRNGLKFYLNDVLIERNQYFQIDMEVQLRYGIGGRTLISAKPLKIDTASAAAMTDEQFLAAWTKVDKRLPGLDYVRTDATMWLPRIAKRIEEFYVVSGFDREKGQAAGAAIAEAAKAAKAVGDVNFAQNKLKEHLRKDYPEGVTKSAPDLPPTEGIMDIQEKPSLAPAEPTPMGDDLINERADALSTALSKIDRDMNYKDASLILRRNVFRPYGGATAQKVVVHPDYIQLTVEQAYIAEITRVRTQIAAADARPATDIETSMPDDDDADTLGKLKTTDAPLGDEAPSPDVLPAKDEPLSEVFPRCPKCNQPLSADGKCTDCDAKAKAEEQAPVTPPTEPTAPKPKFTEAEWKTWAGELTTRWGWQNISTPEILKMLGVARPSLYFNTLDEAGKIVNEAMTGKMVAKLNEQAKAIFNQKQIPAQAWPQICADAGDPAMFLGDNDKSLWLDRISVGARDYVVSSMDQKALSAPGQTSAPTAVAVMSPVASALKLPTPDEFKMLNVLCDFAAQSGFFPGVETAAQALMICWKALEWGISATEALTNIYIIPRSNGGFSLYPGTSILLGKVLASNKVHRFDLPPGDGKVATAIVQRKDEKEPMTFTYTLEEATTAGLTKGPAWRANPNAMLQWRVARRAIKAKFADVMHGFSFGLNEDSED